MSDGGLEGSPTANWSPPSSESSLIPGRPNGVSQVWAWTKAAIFLSWIVALGAIFVGVLDDGDRGALVMLTCIAGLCAARIWTAIRLARNLSFGPGRFVFLVDQHAAGQSSRRLWKPSLTRRPGTGHWVNLVDADDGTDLGWAEVGWMHAASMRGEDVGALWGDPSAPGLSLSGRFATARIYGRLRPDRPVHKSFWTI